MSKGDTWENDLLKLVFNNVAASLIGDASGLQPSGTVGNLYASLHSADPGEAGTQSTSEIVYTGYARVAIPRTSGGFTVAGNQVTLAAAVLFPTGSGGGPGPVTHFGIGTAASGAGKLLYSGPVTIQIVVGNGYTPQLGTGTTITED